MLRDRILPLAENQVMGAYPGAVRRLRSTTRGITGGRPGDGHVPAGLLDDAYSVRERTFLRMVEINEAAVLLLPEMWRFVRVQAL